MTAKTKTTPTAPESDIMKLEMYVTRAEHKLLRRLRMLEDASVQVTIIAGQPVTVVVLPKVERLEK